MKIYILLILLSTVSCHSPIIKTSDYDSQSATEIVFNARMSLQNIVDYAESRTDIFPTERANKKKFPNREQREIVWRTWQSFMDRLIVLDEIGEQFEVIYKNTDGIQKQQAFRISYAAFLARYHYAVGFIDFLENYPTMHTLLNQKVPELGMQKNLYKKVKFHYLNAFRGAEFVRLNILYSFYDKDIDPKLVEGMNEDIKFIWRAGRGVGTKQTIKNALKIIQDTGFTAWFPIQKEVSEWMGDVKVARIKRSLITPLQIKKIHSSWNQVTFCLSAVNGIYPISAYLVIGPMQLYILVPPKNEKIILILKIFLKTFLILTWDWKTIYQLTTQMLIKIHCL